MNDEPIDDGPGSDGPRDDEPTGDAAVAALFELLDVTLERVPGAWGRVGEHDTRLVMSGGRLATFNRVFSAEPVPHVGSVAALAKQMADQERPWSIFSRSEPSPELLAVAAEFGLTHVQRSPLMVRGADPVRPEPGGRDVPTVRLITGADAGRYLDVLAVGFAAPPELLADLMSPAVLDAPGVNAYLVEHHGEPVAAGFGLVGADLVGVYNIATPPPYRSRGYGRLATEAVLRDGLAAGASGAYLLASEMGRPLYRSLGFATIETWTYLTAG